MRYTVEVGMWGAECVAGEIPDKIWKYIQDYLLAVLYHNLTGLYRGYSR